MKVTSLFTLAALSAASLLPVSGALAQDNDTTRDTAMSGPTMSVEEFRGGLNRVHDLFLEMRENQRLALASDAVLNRSHFTEANERLLVETIGVLNDIAGQWPSDPQQYSRESGDTAVVRSIVTDLRNRLTADQLNGRGPMITDEMMTQLQTAVDRAENPSFRLAGEWRAVNADRLARLEETTRTEETVTTRETPAETTSPAPTEETTREETGFVDQDRNRSEILDRNVVIPEPTSVETTRTETVTEEEPMETPTETPDRFGAANEELPQTGGDPGLLVMLGSSLIGFGALLRRRL